MKRVTVAIHSPGEMGHTVGGVLKAHGLRVIACLAGLSERTRRLATDAGLEEAADLAKLVEEADVLLSILPPAQALKAAQDVADALGQTGVPLTYVDCNAIAPATMRQIAGVVGEAGADVIDASIIGPPPRREGVTRFYASGPAADAFLALGEHGLDVRLVGGEIGQASALKMCFATSTKAVTALYAELLTAAHELGVYEALVAEFAISQPEALARMRRMVPRSPRKARRFVGEMEEIAATFEAVGLTPRMLEGAADMFRLLGATPLADTSPEDPAEPPSLAETLAILAEHVDRRQ
jgi:3-hydroxyisobutyrate dehydrogenase-like beta-hydroxyacid dehydrogenase